MPKKNHIQLIHFVLPFQNFEIKTNITKMEAFKKNSPNAACGFFLISSKVHLIIPYAYTVVSILLSF